MRTRLLDEDGDWSFGKGQNDYLSGTSAVVQSIRTRLLSFLGDCFFDTAAGIDWYTRLGAKDDIPLKLDISAIILNTPEVTGLLEVQSNLDPASRGLTVQYVVQTVYSTIPIRSTFTYDFSI